MKEIDVRGLSCPEPIMLTKEALKDGCPLKVIVDDSFTRGNIEKFVTDKGRKVKTIENGNIFEIIIE